MELFIYDVECKLGDYVYADGTYSTFLNKLKTVVGVCFYINPYNKKQRLCVSLSNLSNHKWGLNKTYLPNITLEDNPEYSVYDIPLLTNKTVTGLSTNFVNDEIRDNSSIDGFKVLDKNTFVGEIGFEELMTSLGNYKEKALLPWGLINTLKIIQHRNTILLDGAISLPLPTQSENTSLLQSLYNVINNLVEKNGNNDQYSSYYYPAASQCNCYEPVVKQGEILAERFKAGNWFLPSGGELARLYWYHSKGYEVGVENAIFANAVAQGKMMQFPAQNYYSSTEHNQDLIWCVGFENGYFGAYSKYNNSAVRPVAAF